MSVFNHTAKISSHFVIRMNLNHLIFSVLRLTSSNHFIRFPTEIEDSTKSMTNKPLKTKLLLITDIHNYLHSIRYR